MLLLLMVEQLLVLLPVQLVLGLVEELLVEGLVEQVSGALHVKRRVVLVDVEVRADVVLTSEAIGVQLCRLVAVVPKLNVIWFQF